MFWYGAAFKFWSGKRDSNSRPRPWQGRALPTELFPLTSAFNLPAGSLKTMFWYGAAFKFWSGKRDSNSRPRPWQGRALPTELFPLTSAFNLPAGSLKTMFWYGAAFKFWSGKRDSNSRPRPWQGRALPTELFPRYCFFAIFRWRRNLHFCVVTGGALYENSIHLQPPGEHFFSFFV